jgi:hypothetical protein
MPAQAKRLSAGSGRSSGNLALCHLFELHLESFVDVEGLDFIA